MNSFFWQTPATAYVAPKPFIPDKRVKKMVVEKVPLINGVDVLLPTATSHMTTTQRPTGVNKKCCWKSFETLYDADGRPAMVVVDDFICNLEELVQIAEQPTKHGLKWIIPEITKNSHFDNTRESILTGHGFPGKVMTFDLVSKAGNWVDKTMTECLQPVVSALWPGFKLDQTTTRKTYMMNVLSPENQPGGTWLDTQRLPHNEIDWNLGVQEQGQIVPPSVMANIALTTKFNDTGLGIWRVKQTLRDSNERLSLLETLDDNEVAQGTYTIKKGRRNTFPDLNIRHEIPDPHPHSKLSHAWAEAIAVARFRYNRVVLVDGRRLQHDYMEPTAYPRLTLEPSTGHLTMNSYFWQMPPKT